MSLRSAPSLWVQLINGGALPLEALLLLLLLAGADPGPLPALERLLAWALGAAAPALLLWHRPADPRSLLLLSSTEPLTSHQPLAIVDGARMRVPRMLFAVGVVLLLPLLGWLDSTAALASQLSPLQGSERLVCLMAASGLLALMVWQWQQLVQAIWLLGQNPSTESSSAAPTGGAPASMARNLGLPLLHWPSLEWPAEAERSSRSTWDLSPIPSKANEAMPPDGVRPDDVQSNDLADELPTGEVPAESLEVDALQSDEHQAEDAQTDADPTGEGHEQGLSAEGSPPELFEADLVEAEVIEAEVLEPEVLEPDVIDPGDSTAALAVEPEQPGEHNQGRDLDQQIS